MNSIFSQLAELHDRAETINIAMPLILARYHLILVIVGILGVAISSLFFIHYKHTERERVKLFAKGTSLIFMVILQAGAIGWFLNPLYEFLLKTKNISS